jgi:hypothetical protein
MLARCRGQIAARLAPLFCSIASIPSVTSSGLTLGENTASAQCAPSVAGLPMAGTMRPRSAVDDINDAIPSTVLAGQAGVPKRKKSVFYRTRKTAGVHFKHRHLRYQPWYFCPLCAEPKQQGTCCRREDCREMKP